MVINWIWKYLSNVFFLNLEIKISLDYTTSSGVWNEILLFKRHFKKQVPIKNRSTNKLNIHMFIHLFIHSVWYMSKLSMQFSFVDLLQKESLGSNSNLNLKVDATPSLTRVLLQPSNLRPVNIHPPSLLFLINLVYLQIISSIKFWDRLPVIKMCRQTNSHWPPFQFLQTFAKNCGNWWRIVGICDLWRSSCTDTPTVELILSHELQSVLVN